MQILSLESSPLATATVAVVADTFTSIAIRGYMC